MDWMINSAFTSWPHSTKGQFQVQTSTLYLRTAFSGLDLIAAYECQFFYKDGIVAYLNGVEIYRDNLPKGVLHPFVTISNSYSIADYHKVIRVGNEIKRGENHLAVVLYFQSSSPQSTFGKTFINRRIDRENTTTTTTTSTSGLTVSGVGSKKGVNEKGGLRQQHQLSLTSNAHINYYSRMACYASSLPFASDHDLCYPVIPPTVIVGAAGPTSYLTDFDLETFFYMTLISSAYYMHYELPPSQVNKFLLFHSVSFSTLTQISFKSRESIQSGWTTEIFSNTLSSIDLLAGGQAVFQFPTYPHSPYPQHRIYPQASSGSFNIMVEMIPLVCYQPIERKRVTLSLLPSYTWAVGDEVNVRATDDYEEECFVDGNLPVGLTMTVGCGIRGNLTEVATPYSVIVYWEDELGTQSMKITMEVKPQPRSSEMSALGTIIVVVVVVVLCICLFLLYLKKRKTTIILPKHKGISKPPGHIELTSHSQVIITPSVTDPNYDQSVGNGQGGNQSSLQSPGTTPSIPFSSNSIPIPYVMDPSAGAGAGTGTGAGTDVIDNVQTSSYSNHSSSGNTKLHSTSNPIGQGNSNSPIHSYTPPGHINIIPASANGNYSIPPPSDSNGNYTTDSSVDGFSDHNRNPPTLSISVNSDLNSNGFATSHFASVTSSSVQNPPIHPPIPNHSNTNIPVKATTTSAVNNNTTTTATNTNQQRQQKPLRPPPLSQHLQQLQYQKQQQQQQPLRPPLPPISKQLQSPNQQSSTSSSSSSQASGSRNAQSLPNFTEHDQSTTSQKRVSLLSAPNGPQTTEGSHTPSLSSNSQENLLNRDGVSQTPSVLSNSMFTTDVGATPLPLSISERHHQQLLQLQQQQQQQNFRPSDSVIANKSTISSKLPHPNPAYLRLPLPPNALPRNNNLPTKSMLRPVPHPYGTLIHHNPSVNSDVTHIDDHSISSGKQ